MFIMLNLYQKIFSQIKKDPHSTLAPDDLYGVLYSLMREDGAKHLPLCRDVGNFCDSLLRRGILTDAETEKYYYLHKNTTKLAAPMDFDSFLTYVEWNRDPKKKFYEPRREILRPLVQDLQDLSEKKISFLGISLPPRVGKALSFDTPVLTRNGWKKHGDLTIRDEVIAPDGRFVRVLAIHDPCEMEYEVEFSNGEKVICHGNHEWTVYNRHRNRIDTLETKEMLLDYENDLEGRGHRYHYMLPEREAVIGDEKELPIDPYVLGVWLGDGRNTNPDICGSVEDCEIIVKSICEHGYEVAWNATHKTTGVQYFGIRKLREQLQSEGMCHSRRRTDKHIPDAYYTASVAQRLELLAGLIDTDGSLIKKENRYQFTTSEEVLRDDFVKLVSTFGWRCSVICHEPSISSSGVKANKPHYTICFNPTMHIPCRLERKQLNVFSKKRRVSITKITPCHGQMGNCITVEGGVYCVGHQMVPTHNSTLCIFFMTWIMGKHPDDASVMTGHSSKLTDGFYDEILSIIGETNEYLWYDVFPGINIADKSTENTTIDLVKKKRFSTMTCRSIGGTLTGAVEVGSNGILYADDLIEDLEESLNPMRLKAKYDAYLNQMKDRKKEEAVELMVGTRWNVMDPLGRVAQQYGNDPKRRFRVIPALNEEGESNFHYKHGVGFSTAYYEDMKASIDDATWCAKYMGRPYVREGLLFPEDELQTYNGVLPDGDPMKIAVCDVAWGGGDSLVTLFLYVYGSSVYVHDVIYNRGDKEVTYPAVIGRAKLHLPAKLRFEADNGGSEYADHVDSLLRKEGVHINIFSVRASNQQSKLARIIQYAPDIKKFYFIADKHRSKEYKAFMSEVTTFVQTGKNLHDDACDALAMAAEELYSGAGTVEIFKRPV